MDSWVWPAYSIWAAVSADWNISTKLPLKKKLTRYPSTTREPPNITQAEKLSTMDTE